MLKDQTQEWSGSATFTSDGKIRLFYTDFSGKHYGKQTLTTAQVNVSASDSSLNINGVEDHKSIFDGDGKTYQNVQQFIDEGNYSSGDNHTLRDPHYVEDKETTNT
nr:glycoside hydrolase family 68 protein [Bacillus subtilis]